MEKNASHEDQNFTHFDSMRILDVVRVGPPSDSDESLTLPITFFDLRWLTCHPVDRVIFYRLTESTRSSFDNIIVPKLHSSLSLALRHYLPLSGRLVWDPREPKPKIVRSQCDAVSVTLAESDSDFSHLCGDSPRVATEFHPLVPELPISDESSPVIAFQITLFPKQGFCIGVSAHHAVLDGKTTAIFLKAWAHLCNQERGRDVTLSLPYDLTPFLDRTVIQDPAGIETKLLNHWLSVSSDNKRSLKPLTPTKVNADVVRVTYRLTRQDVQKLRERVENESPECRHLHLSTFVVAYGYIITCLVKARGGDASRRVCFGFASDFRSRLYPPVPETYLGNCVVGTCEFNGKAGVLSEEEKGFISAVERLSDMVKGLGPEMMEKGLLGSIEFFKKMEPGTQVVSIAGSTRLGVYGSDFGWGKPEKVEIVSIDKDGAVAMAESPHETVAIEFGLCMKKYYVAAFESIFSQGLK